MPLLLVLLVLLLALSVLALHRRWLGWFLGGITFVAAVASYVTIGLLAARDGFVSVPFGFERWGDRAAWLSVMVWMVPWACIGLVVLRRLGRPRSRNDTDLTAR